MEQEQLVASQWGDILESDPSLEANSTFNMDVLDETMRTASLRSFWNLYKLQRDKVGLRKFVLRFSDFIQEARMPGQTDCTYYPKQYVHYFNYRMLPAGKEESFRRSKLYGAQLTMRTIADNAKYFSHNFLVFLDKKLLTTAEFYPMGDKVRVSIDVAVDEIYRDGISISTYRQFVDEDPEVIVYLVPNYTIKIKDFNYKELKDKRFLLEESLASKTKETIPDVGGQGLSFMNLMDDYALLHPLAEYPIKDVEITKLVKDPEDPDKKIPVTKLTPKFHIKVRDDFHGKTVRLCTISWEHGFKKGPVTKKDQTCFTMGERYPVPMENFFVFAVNSAKHPQVLGTITSDVRLKHFYPNLYQADPEYFEEREPEWKPPTSDVILEPIMSWDTEPGYRPKPSDQIFKEPYPDNPSVVSHAGLRVYGLENDEGTMQVEIPALITDPEPDEPYVPPEETPQIPKEETSELLFFVFYNDLLTTENEAYHNDMEFYFSRVDDMRYRLEKGGLDSMVTGYDPETFSYSPEEYDSSIWFPKVTNYKFATFRKFIENNPQILELYWDIMGPPADKHYVDCSKIDLSDRLRTDNSPEIGDLAKKDVVSFGDTTRYVFAMYREFLSEDEFAHRIWVDGVLLLENEYLVHEGHNFYYLYIPTTMVQKNSLLEIERYRLCNDKHEMAIPEEVEMPYRISYIPPCDRKIQAGDIYVVNAATGKYLKYYEEYTLERYSKQLGRWVLIPRKSAYITDGEEIRIVISSPELKGITIHYGAYQAAYMISSEPFDPGGDNPTLVGKQMPYIKMDVPNLGNYDKSSYRMFLNHRACSTGQFYLRQSMTYGGTDSIRSITELQEGDVLTLDRVPGSYRLVCFEDMISENGYVDLDGKIPLPLSFKWYDIYLNGLRLNRNHVDFVSPTKMYIKGVKSRRNLVIYERNHDDDVFYLPSYALKKHGLYGSIMDKLFELSYAVKTEMDALYSILIESERDVLEGGQYPERVIFSIIIFEEIFKYTFFNPNKKESSAKKIGAVIEEYPTYFNGGVFNISGNVNPSASLVLEVNANQLIEKQLEKQRREKYGF